MTKEKHKAYFPVGISGAGKDYIWHLLFAWAVIKSRFTKKDPYGFGLRSNA